MDTESTLLLTDLYQLTMAQGYYAQGMEDTAVFEFFVRRLPPQRNFLVAAGLEQVLDFVENARFGAAELEWLRSSGRFDESLLEHLRDWRFSGDIHALPEGSVFFANEPVLRVTAPLPEAQLLETRLINLLHFQILIASKAVRCTLAAGDRLLVDFGLRRAHGAEAGLMAARASWLGGFAGTSTVLAAPRFGIPIYGTMAHSFVQAHDSESLAFEHFAAAQPDNVVLLIDTYDTEAAAAKVVRLAPRLAAAGIRIRAVRLDSGDLVEHSRRVRTILDDGGLEDVRIFCSGNLDEYAIADLVAAGAPVDGFGVGTRLDTSADAPYLDSAYKLIEYAGRPRRKRSEGKALWPGRKQVVRTYDQDGIALGDRILLEDECPPGEGRLVQVMAGGRRLAPPPEPAAALEAARARLRQELDTLPEALRVLEPGPAYPVEISPTIQALAAELDTVNLAPGNGDGS